MPLEGGQTEEYKREAKKFCGEIELILHTVNENEYKAAVIGMEKPPEYFSKAASFSEDTCTMVLGMFSGLKTALIQTGQGDDCRSKITKVLKDLKLLPKACYIIGVGVCYAFNEQKFKLGDVLVANKISDFSTWKAGDTFIDRGETKNVDDMLEDIFCKGLVEHNPKFEVNKSTTRVSKVKSGPFISLNALVNNKAIRDKFHDARPEAIGGEMEGGALMKVMKEVGQIKGVIIIKGVVDYADGNKEKDWQLTSAMAAVSYAKSKLDANGRHTFYGDEVLPVPTPPEQDQAQRVPAPRQQDQHAVNDYLCKSAPLMGDIRSVTNKEGKKYQLLGKISGKWRVFGDLLEMENGVLNNISTLNDINDKFGRVFTEWSTNAELPKSQDYPYTWQGFRTLLDDAGLSQVSKDYFAFLETV